MRLRTFSAVAAFCMLACAGCDRRTAPEVLLEPAAKDLFYEHVIDPAPPGGHECCTDVLALADMNGDGIGDIVVGGEGTRRFGMVSSIAGRRPGGAGLVWYEYATWQRHDIGNGEFTTDVEAVDFDRDGDMDVVVGDSSAGAVWFENRDGKGLAWERHLIGAGFVHDLEVADLNGDGLNDVIVGDVKAVHAFLQESAGKFRKETLITRPREGLKVADLDGDGDPDVLYANLWLENRRDGTSSTWVPHDIAPQWEDSTRIQVGDLNKDGRLDVVLTGSEGKAPVSWFEAPEDRANGSWIEHPITRKQLTGAHSLVVADIDLDGDLDVVTAEMHTGGEKRVLAFLNDGDSWREVLLARHGSHNMAAADLDGDGDIDLVGKNYGGTGRFVELWENRAADLKQRPAAVTQSSPATQWSYEPVDTQRPMEELHKFGLLSADMDGDGDQDIVAGGVLYVNPGPDPGAAWKRIVVSRLGDVIHASDRLFHGWRGLVAGTDTDLVLLEAGSDDGANWSARRLQALPPGRTQGYARAPAQASGAYDVYFTRGQTLLKLTVPTDPAQSWPLETISTQVDEAGLALADLDSDGDVDIVTVEAGAHRLLWLENNPGEPMRPHPLGASLRWIDRVAIADIDGDGRQDIVFTEETRDLDYNARVAWLAAPEDRSNGQWRMHVITTLRSANSLGVVDMDRDGRADVLIGEHTDMRSADPSPDTFTGIFLNRGARGWEEEVIDIGPRSSHLGALAVDLGNHGQYDVVSVGWEQSCCVHRWRKKQPK